MTPGGERGTARVRRADPEDLAAVVRLDRDCFGDHAWSAASWSDEFDRLADTRLILIAEAPTTAASPSSAGGDVSSRVGGDVSAAAGGGDSVAEVGGDGEAVEVIGYVVVIVPDHPGEAVDLARIGVAPAWRRTGVATSLVEAALPTDRTVLLEVAEGNIPARRFYERHDFGEISRRKGYYPGGEDALILRRIG